MSDIYIRDVEVKLEPGDRRPLMVASRGADRSAPSNTSTMSTSASVSTCVNDREIGVPTGFRSKTAYCLNPVYDAWSVAAMVP